VVTHPPRKTRFRLLVRLYRTGLVTRRVPSERFQASDYPPFPSFLARGQIDQEETAWFLSQNSFVSMDGLGTGIGPGESAVLPLVDWDSLRMIKGGSGRKPT